ncbi:MAG: RluA family pseudouridine synthase [Thermoanaerobaculia bacterium]
MTTPVRVITADRGDDRERLDRVLLRHLAGLPEATRTKIQTWIQNGFVTVNGRRPGKSSEKVKTGEKIEVLLPAPPPARSALVAQDIPLSVLWEDEHLLVLDKPAGLVVHPAVGHRDGTLVNALLHRSKEWAGPADRPGLVHRLDKDTSGVLVVAKTEMAMSKLGIAMKERSLEKEYLAVVYGSPPVRKGRIDFGILRDPRDRKRMATSKSSGRPSTTFYEILGESSGSLSGLTLVKCRLVTGRTHQIRVHLKALHLPIVGDPVYGAARWKGLRDEELREACRTFPRQALHAWRLSLAHPISGETLTFIAPIPADISSLLETASLSASSV